MPRFERSALIDKFKAMVARGEPIIGGGAGTGLSAKCQEAGGIDLIVIYNSGRYRMAGRGSLAGLLAYGDANQIVVEMAAEVLPLVLKRFKLTVPQAVLDECVNDAFAPGAMQIGQALKSAKPPSLTIIPNARILPLDEAYAPLMWHVPLKYASSFVSPGFAAFAFATNWWANGAIFVKSQFTALIFELMKLMNENVFARSDLMLPGADAFNAGSALMIAAYANFSFFSIVASDSPPVGLMEFPELTM